ncbi:MAG TPA: anthranilate phosphoribosyltransferase [Thermoanaerobaculia bacterium]|nr:anthranilate phosphoribosyltransferase [Thermoanaerobaculia bacterium]
METRELLRRVIAGEDLERAEVRALFGALMDGALSEVHKTAVLVALAAKGESPDEIAGAAEAMRERVIRIPHGVEDALDTCGTGGDGRGTFNVSTAAALVAAAGGARVAKHGNRSVSSRSGSADVLAELGVDLELEPAALGRALEQVGIAFLFAPRLHPAMREVMPVRRELGVRTLFNLLGPLTNPAGARRQLMGVYARELVEPLGRVLLELGSEHALVVHGADGLDEITTTGATTVCEVRDGVCEVYQLEPARFGLPRRALEELAGGDPAENARELRAVLEGGGRPALGEITALNAGAALYVAGRAASLEQGVELAREVLARGAGAEVLARLVGFERAGVPASGDQEAGRGP